MKRFLALCLGVALLAALLFSTVIASGCGSEDPSQKIDKAITKSGDIKSGHVDYDLKIDVKGDASALGSEFEGLLPLSLGVKGGVDFAKKDNDKVAAKGNVQIEGLDQIMQSLAASQGSTDATTTLGVGMISSFLSDLQFVIIDKTLYLKLAGSWYKTDASSVGDMADLSGAAANAGDVDTACMQNAMKDSSKFGAAKIMSNIQEVGKETINGTDTTHIKAELNLDGALTATADAMRSCGDSEAAGSLEAGKTELNSMFKTKSIEMWIDGDNNMVRVKVDVQLDPKAISDLAGSMAGGTSTTDGASGLDSIGVSMTLTMSKINESMDIQKPEGNIMDLEDLFGSSLGSDLLGGSDISGLEGLEGLDSGTSTTGTSTSGTSTRSRTSSSNPSM
jgi:hypothetical protein